MNQTPEKLLSEQKKFKEVKRQITGFLLILSRKQPSFTGIIDLKLRVREGSLTGGVVKESEEDLDWIGLSEYILKHGNGGKIKTLTGKAEMI